MNKLTLDFEANVLNNNKGTEPYKHTMMNLSDIINDINAQLPSIIKRINNVENESDAISSNMKSMEIKTNKLEEVISNGKRKNETINARLTELENKGMKNQIIDEKIQDIREDLCEIRKQEDLIKIQLSNVNKFDLKNVQKMLNPLYNEIESMKSQIIDLKDSVILLLSDR